MSIRFIHTSDWHIGRVFRFAGDETMGVLQEARLGAISRIGELAREHRVRHVFVAGDVYDAENLAPLTFRQPLERMRPFAEVEWHLLPGNHDLYRPNGLWDRLLAHDVPANVHFYRTPRPELFAAEGFALLPAPLRYPPALADPTAYMAQAEVPGELVRVGLAHGSVINFGTDARQAQKNIAPDRPEQAGLSYLALGDWHGQKRITDRCWYSGTPETDDFGVIGGGHVLLVEVAGRCAPPVVTSLQSGAYAWLNVRARLNGREDIDTLAERLRALPHPLDRELVRLSLEGTISLEERSYLRVKIADGVAAAFRLLATDDENLISRATVADLDRIGHSGFVRVAAETLQQKTEHGDAHESKIAEAALQRLYLEHVKLQGAPR